MECVMALTSLDTGFLMQRICSAVRLRRSLALQVRHCNNSLKHTESTYYEEFASGFCTLVKGCKAEPQVGHHGCTPLSESQLCRLMG